MPDSVPEFVPGYKTLTCKITLARILCFGKTGFETDKAWKNILRFRERKSLA